MALTLTAKPATAVYRYTWNVPVVDGDTIAAFTHSATGCTVDSYEIDGSAIGLFISGGTDNTTASITVSVETGDGETIPEVLLIPIRSRANSLGQTARDICLFALRPITGVADEPEADELADALEQFNDMVAEWRIDGLDVGIPGTLAEGATIDIADEYISALKFNLRVRVCDFYGMPIRQTDFAAAERGKMLVGNRLISFTDLTMPLQSEGPMTGINDV